MKDLPDSLKQHYAESEVTDLELAPTETLLIVHSHKEQLIRKTVTTGKNKTVVANNYRRVYARDVWFLRGERWTMVT